MSQSNNALNIIFGFNEADLGQGRQTPVFWSEQSAVNAHMLIAGKSGSGKTTMLRRIVDQIVKKRPEGVRIHAFDVHGDLGFSNESAVLFSESTNYGINPLHLSSHPHFGGVRKRVQSFIDMINDSSRELGPRQTSTLRTLLYDLYELHGFRINDPTTWELPKVAIPSGAIPGRTYLDIPFDEKDIAKDCARREGLSLVFDPNLKAWHTDRYEGSLQRWPTKTFGRRMPHLQDAAAYAANRMRALAAGGGSKSMRLLDEHNRKVAQWCKLAKKMADETSPDVKALKDEIHASSLVLIETFTDYVMSIETGKELDNLIRYDSVDTVRSLVDRLETLIATGIYKAVEPKFDPTKPVWRYDIAPLSAPEQQMFVWTRLTQVMEEALERGPTRGPSEMREVFILDEAHKFFLEKETNILDRLSKEARKFGLGLICASQSPSHFSEDFLANVGTKILLGIDSMYWDQTVRKMKIDPQVLKMVVPGRVAAIQTASREAADQRFVQTRVRF